MRTTELLFYGLNALPMPLWAVWIAAPKSALSRRLATALWPWAILAATYAVLIVTAMFVFPAGPDALMSSLPGVMAIFDSEWATLAGWTHYLCFDAFVARWIMNDAPEAGYAITPILLFTLMFGPVGLLLYLTFRARLRGAA